MMLSKMESITSSMISPASLETMVICTFLELDIEINVYDLNEELITLEQSILIASILS